MSSTGHLILVGDLIGFQGPPGKVFEVVIQLGAILAVVLGLLSPAPCGAATGVPTTGAAPIRHATS